MNGGRTRGWRDRWWSVPLAGVVAVGCSAGAGEDPVAARHEVVDADLQPLRSAFEEDSGKARAILLASPT